MTDIGFIGLGSMGSAMALRLVQAGHRVHVWNRSQGPVDELVAQGAIAATSPREALSTGIAVSMLANDAAVESVFTAEALTGLAGALHVNMSSVSPATARRLQLVHEAEGVDYLAAPVMGRPPVAASGQLNILAAGAPGTHDRVTGLFEVLGARTWWLGERPEQANVAKIAMNYLLIHTIQSLGEAIALSERNGIVPEQFVDLATSTMFSGPAHKVYGGIIAERRYHPAGFGMPLGLKDLGLATAVAEESGLSLPSAPMLRTLFETALADPDLAGADWAAVAELTRRGVQ